MPLDSITSKEIRKVAGRKRLAAWPGVRYLTATVSEQFQRVAAEEGTRKGLARVHLDAYWWSVGRDEVAVFRPDQ